MAACLSPVNLSAPMSSFFLRPAERQFQPFQQELVKARGALDMLFASAALTSVQQS